MNADVQRLSLGAGELSESQKEEIERHRSLVKQQDHELTECRQQLAKLSNVVDKQSEEIRELNTDMRYGPCSSFYRSRCGDIVQSRNLSCTCSADKSNLHTCSHHKKSLCGTWCACKMLQHSKLRCYLYFPA